MPRLWSVGAARVLTLFIVAVGAYLLGDLEGAGLCYLMAFYALGLATSIGYLYSARRDQVPTLLTWAQLLVDFGVALRADELM